MTDQVPDKLPSSEELSRLHEQSKESSEVNQYIVETLEDMVEQAKRGEILGTIIISTNKQGDMIIDHCLGQVTRVACYGLVKWAEMQLQKMFMEWWEYDEREGQE